MCTAGRGFIITDVVYASDNTTERQTTSPVASVMRFARNVYNLTTAFSIGGSSGTNRDVQMDNGARCVVVATLLMR